MASQGRRKERTLTAVRSPLGAPEAPSIPVLFLAGRARPGSSSTEPRHRLLGDELLLGRAVEGQGWELADALVSSRHAHLRWVDGGVEIEDLASKNGSFLGGHRLVGRALWPPGTPLFLGDHAFVWRLLSPLALQAVEDEGAHPFGPVASASPALALTLQKLRRWAPTKEEILLLGETGVGKEVYARAVHSASGRRGPWQALNCAALPAELVESELFGYRPGAHSTARAAKAGLFERAEGGTLFLDEVGEMPGAAQAKLLRFLQDREVTPLGGTETRRLDVRVLAATNRPVESALPGALRADLLGRLGAAPVILPPLRDRIEDLGALATHLLREAGGAAAVEAGYEGPAFRALFRYAWPLNVRELGKVLAAAVALTAGARPIALRDLPAGMSAPASEVPAAAPPSAARKAPAPGPTPEELARLLRAHGGNVADVSRALGRQRAAVWRWIKRFGLSPRGEAGGDPERVDDDAGRTPGK